MGEHWQRGPYSDLYGLYRRVEDMAKELELRRRGGLGPLKDHTEELFDIATQLKILDTKLISPRTVGRKAKTTRAPTPH